MFTMQATRDSEIMNDTKEQADWLLHNIIPEHVSNILKKSSKYCENHKDVGVLFAKVVNYDDFYDESYEVIIKIDTLGIRGICRGIC